MKLYLDTWRWSGVPFYLRTGKAMARRDTEIVLQFRPVPCALFGHGAATMPTNRLVIRDPARRGDQLRFPREIARARPSRQRRSAWTFATATISSWAALTGYETLLYDIMTGDQTLFQRADAIEGSLGGRAADPRRLEPRPRPAAELQGREQWTGSGRRVARPGRPCLAFARSMRPARASCRSDPPARHRHRRDARAQRQEPARGQSRSDHEPGGSRSDDDPDQLPAAERHAEAREKIAPRRSNGRIQRRHALRHQRHDPLRASARGGRCGGDAPIARQAERRALGLCRWSAGSSPASTIPISRASGSPPRSSR